MKKHNFLSKLAMFLVPISVSMFLLSGCQSKSTTAADNTTSKPTASSTQNSSQMKQKMEDNIKSLVTAGTINQSQADKIIQALTSNSQRPNRNGQNGNGKPQNGGQNGQNSQNGQNKKPMNSPLSKLVSDGTITQAQADAVMQKIRGNFGHRNSNQTSN